MTTARVSHQRLCRFAVTGGECDCHALRHAHARTA